MMYGFYPNGVWEEDGPLQQALTLCSRVAQVKEIPAGTAVSYGCTFVSEKPMKIAVISAGYADAYPRSLSNKGAWAVINGEKCRQIGRVCMDMCLFDVTGVDVKRGSICKGPSAGTTGKKLFTSDVFFVFFHGGSLVGG